MAVRSIRVHAAADPIGAPRARAGRADPAARSLSLPIDSSGAR